MRPTWLQWAKWAARLLLFAGLLVLAEYCHKIPDSLINA